MREAKAIIAGTWIALTLPSVLHATELHPLLEEKLQGKSSQERRAILLQECARKKPHHRHGHHVADVNHAKRLAAVCKQFKKLRAQPASKTA